MYIRGGGDRRGTQTIIHARSILIATITDGQHFEPTGDRMAIVIDTAATQ
ncbi:hypothetical protein [Devosia sp. SL43]|nr:hypothetical protein [Devosia sp. SL43]UJW84073.1 hypothetical protein IM737_11465 [Devosia sp. SL43]